MIQSVLADIPGLKAVDRLHLKKILDEQDFQKSIYVDKKKTVEIGKILGARVGTLHTGYTPQVPANEMDAWLDQAVGSLTELTQRAAEEESRA